MKQNYFIKFFTTVLMVFTISLSAQNYQDLWSNIDAFTAKSFDQLPRKIEPIKERFYQLNLVGLKSALTNLGNRENPGNTIITFPNSNGEMKRYRVFEASIMEPKLQAKYPELMSYAGQGIDNPSETVRFSVTPKGLHAMFLGTDDGTQFIDPFSSSGNVYTIYSKGDLMARNFEWECGVIDDPLLDRSSDLDTYARNPSDGTLRDYRLAIACTGEYGTFHGGTVSGVMAAMMTTMTRVNGIYERDLSVTMTMIDNTSVIFFDGATDPFDNNNAGILINQSQSVIDANIGSGNYDIGHTFSTGGGGLAQLNSTCGPSKARGITGSPVPQGDAYDVDFVAHELGHQFGAPHTFNGDGGPNCLNQRSGTDAYEPGSGSTIMAYAGICPPQNVQNNSDAYFHQISLVRMFNHVLSTGACPTNRSSTGNSVPVANAGGDFTIPQNTPYKLTGSSTDPDGTSQHTFTWEQFDLGPQGAPSSTLQLGPIVRSFEGTTNPMRYVPRLQDLKSSNGSTAWEILSTVNRDLNYRLTVRDNDSRGGQTDFDQMTATVTTAAGPFIVTSQNTPGVTWTEGATETITWDVAGTTGNGINEANVNILFSEDGENYNTVLASNVPNDGSQDITVPSGVSSINCRIMVEAVNGIFFNINTEDISIGATQVCTPYSTGPISTAIPDGPGANQQGTPVFIPITINDSGTINGNITVSVDVTHSYIGDLVMQLQSPGGSFANIWARDCNSAQFGDINMTFKDGEPPIVCASPTTGTFAPSSPLSTFDGEDINGTWNLVFVDFFIGDTGVVNSWSLEFCTALSIDDNELDGFALYPNPNNGEFQIGFNPKSGEQIVIEVFDITGRAVYLQSFDSVSRFEEVIRLNEAQSGMYLLNIYDGSQKVTKKIVVE